MRIELLHLDEGLTHQEIFLATAENAGAYALDLRASGRQVRLWGMDSELGAVKSQLPTSSEPILTFMGSGDFHHVTALLLERLAEASVEPFTIIHFDNHPDWVRFSGGMHCGSWVNRALAIPSVSKIVTLGVCSHDLRFPECKGGNLKAMSEGRLELFPFAHLPAASGTITVKVRGSRSKAASFTGAIWQARTTRHSLNFTIARDDRKYLYHGG